MSLLQKIAKERTSLEEQIAWYLFCILGIVNAARPAGSDVRRFLANPTHEQRA